MARTRRKRCSTRARSASRPVAVAMLASALVGCGWAQAPVLDPQGPVALAERDLLLAAAALMLIVVVPVYGLTIVLLRRYRASRLAPDYDPEWSYSAALDAAIWAAPALIIGALGLLVWTYTHRLDPYRRIASDVPAIEVQVISQDWKWLFLYPAYDIALVNELVFVAGRPLNLKLTSDSVMNSFFIPGLGGQIYTMPGMQTKLHLLADRPVTLVGRNTLYSGRGFSDQSFKAHARSQAEFDAWVAEVKGAPLTLDDAAYDLLSKPSSRVAPIRYGAVAADLFDRVIASRRAGDAPHAPSALASPHR
jgi:cytochrome o ubiquinol oxidase subunit 2